MSEEEINLGTDYGRPDAYQRKLDITKSLLNGTPPPPAPPEEPETRLILDGSDKSAGEQPVPMPTVPPTPKPRALTKKDYIATMDAYLDGCVSEPVLIETNVGPIPMPARELVKNEDGFAFFVPVEGSIQLRVPLQTTLTVQGDEVVVLYVGSSFQFKGSKYKMVSFMYDKSQD